MNEIDAFESIFQEAKREAERFNFADPITRGSKYFLCGYNNLDEPFYNYTIATAIAIIGKLYYSEPSRLSNYKKGITYIANELVISKSEIKALRKKLHRKRGYVFATPYTIPKIIEKMIQLLKDKETEEIIIKFLEQRRSDLYREILIEKQYSAIGIAANNGNREKVYKVYHKLEHLTQKVGR